MKIFNLNKLDYLHDALIEDFNYSINIDGQKCCKILIKIDEDCGDPCLNGLSIVFRFDDIVLFGGTFFGISIGLESINSIKIGLDENERKIITQFSKIGISHPTTELTFLLQSGTKFFIASNNFEFDFLT